LWFLWWIYRSVLCGADSVTEHCQILSIFLIEDLLVTLLSVLFAGLRILL
jgi:hypothetical protein